MGVFSDNYRGDIIFDKDDENLKIPSWRKSKIKNYYWENRYASPNYVNSLSKPYTKQVVIKIISRGIGKKNLSQLFGYIMRELPNQKKEGLKPVLLEDNYRAIYSGDSAKTIIEEWSNNFNSYKSEIDEKLYEELESYNLNIAVLENKQHEKTIIPEEEQELSYLRTQSPLKKQFQKLPKDFTHIVFSTGGEVQKEKQLTIIRNLLEENLGSKGYEYVFAYHDDTKNPHIHVVVKNDNILQKDNDKPFALDKYDLLMLRTEFARHCDLQGLDRTATRAYDREKYLTELKATPEKILKLKNNYETNLAKKEDYYSFNAFTLRENLIKNTNRYIETIEAQVKKEPELNKTVKILKIIQKDIASYTDEDFGQMRAKTIKELEKFNKKVAGEFLEILSLPPSHMPDKEQKRIINMVNDIEKKRLEEVDLTMQVVRKFAKNASKELLPKVDFLLDRLNDLYKDQRMSPKDISKQRTAEITITTSKMPNKTKTEIDRDN